MDCRTTNTPVWSSITRKKPTRPQSHFGTGQASKTSELGSFQEVWYLSLHNPKEKEALSLRFSILISANGFRRVAEVMGVYFQKTSEQEVSKVAVRQIHDIGSFSYSPEAGVHIGECSFSENRTQGKIVTQGRSIQWNLSLDAHSASQNQPYELTPSILKKIKLAKSSVLTPHPSLHFTGTIEINGRISEWQSVPGMQGHQSGPRNSHSWLWAHCNSFLTEKGDPVAFSFEGLTSRSRWLGQVPLPRICSFHFQYQDQSYLFNSLETPLRLRCSSGLNEWSFQADRDDLSFRGQIKAEFKDFAGLNLEDTDGSLIYCSTTQLASVRFQIYRSGKLETVLVAPNVATFEQASRVRNPYVPQLL